MEIERPNEPSLLHSSSRRSGSLGHHSLVEGDEHHFATVPEHARSLPYLGRDPITDHERQSNCELSDLGEQLDHDAVAEKLTELNMNGVLTPSDSTISHLTDEFVHTSVFSGLTQARETTGQLLEAMYENDLSPEKVFLASEGFRTNEARPWYLPVIRTVEAQIAEDLTLHKEFTKNDTGLRAFVEAASRLILGDDSPAFLDNRVSSIQTPGGSAAIYVGLSVLRKIYHFTTIYVPWPTTGNFREIALNLNYTVKDYRYLDADNRYLDMDAFLHSLQNAEEESIVVLHIDCTHKPSTRSWYDIMDTMKKRHLFPLFYVNGLGLSSGDLYTDSFPVRLFVNDHHDMMVAQSFSKIFGLGDDSVGNICIIGPDAEEMRIISANLRSLVNIVWGCTSHQAARVVVTIVNNPALAAEWREHIRTMAERVRMLRVMLFQKLLSAGTLWEHILVQSGMFLSTGLTDSQLDELRQTYHIYINTNGIINLSCLTSTNLDYVTSAFHDVISSRLVTSPFSEA